MEKHIDREAFMKWLESNRGEIVGSPCAWGGVFAEYLRDQGERQAIEIAPGVVCDGPLTERHTLPAWASDAQRVLWHAAISSPKRGLRDARMVAFTGADVLTVLGVARA